MPGAESEDRGRGVVGLPPHLPRKAKVINDGLTWLTRKKPQR